jgi:thymidylate kinase
MMPPVKDSVPEHALTQCLRELPDCVVLRNEEDLFGNLQRGGDVDLLVGDLELAERILIHHLGCPIRIIRRSYVREYSYDWGTVDLLPSIEWRGVRYLRTDAIVDGRRISERGRPVPRLAHEAVISWLTSLLWGGFFKERYASIIHRAVEVDGVALRQALIEAAGNKWGDRLWWAAADGHPETSATWARALRRAIWWRAWFRSPVRTIEQYLAFVTAELRLRWDPPVPWIAILGSDGSGKSSLVNELVHRYSQCPYADVRALHCRPRLIARPQNGEPVTDPHGKSYRGPIASVLSLLFLAADWMVGYWTRLVHLRSKGYVLAFDRMYFDLVVDPKRYRYGAGPRLARSLWWMFPKPDLVFFLDLTPDALWHRKQEVPLAELARQRQAYQALLRELPSGKVLDGSLALSVLADAVQCAVRAWMLDRSAASLTGLHAPVTTDEGQGGASVSVGHADGSVDSGASC